MSKPKLTKLDDFIRGDTPLFVFNATVDGVALDITSWTGVFTLTSNATPTGNTDAVISAATMTKDTVARTFSYQLTHALSQTLVPGTTYYFDVQIQKTPTETNTFTIARGTVGVATDFGV
jgi:hypothetical protein